MDWKPKSREGLEPNLGIDIGHREGLNQEFQKILNKYEQQSIKLFLHHTLLVASILCFVLSANSVKIVSLCMTNVILHDQ